MKMVGKRSVASLVRLALGVMNVFVMVGMVATGGVFLVSLFAPLAGGEVLDALNEARPAAGEALGWAGRLVFLGAFLACGFTWWIINRLRRILLSVNQGEAFEPANVGRMRAIGVSLIGFQLVGLALSLIAPDMIGQDAGDYDFDPGAWLGVLVVFILAEVFRQGSEMRDEQQKTI